MKKLILVFLCFVFSFACWAPHGAAAAPGIIKVTLDGKLMTFDQNPVIQNGRVLVPLRKIFESLGAQVTWSDKERTITAVNNDQRVKLNPGVSRAYINSAAVMLDQPPVNINGRILVPVRFVSEAMGAVVEWNSQTRTVQISSGANRKTWISPPLMQIDTNKSYQAIIHTSMGDITVKLFAQDAPNTVNNFVFLARNKFYDNVIFHRIIETFMIQTGDPKGDGTGGPGYSFEDELSPKHSYKAGILAMANAGPDTNGSQFFIGSGSEVENLNRYPAYTIFGQVTAGMDVVRKIAAVKVGSNAFGEISVPKERVFIKSVEILEK